MSPQKECQTATAAASQIAVIYQRCESAPPAKHLRGSKWRRSLKVRGHMRGGTVPVLASVSYTSFPEMI